VPRVGVKGLIQACSSRVRRYGCHTFKYLIKINDKLMDDKKPSTKEKIYDYIDMDGLRRYLLHHPHLLIIFEFLVIHVDNHLQI